jgi:hypothetical protein
LAATAKRLYNGGANTSFSIAYTVPTNKTAIIKNISICNVTGSSLTVSIKLAGTYIMYNSSIAANDTVVLELSQVLNAGETIEVSSSTTNGVHLLISGVEVS